MLLLLSGLLMRTIAISLLADVHVYLLVCLTIFTYFCLLKYSARGGCLCDSLSYHQLLSQCMTPPNALRRRIELLLTFWLEIDLSVFCVLKSTVCSAEKMLQIIWIMYHAVLTVCSGSGSRKSPMHTPSLSEHFCYTFTLNLWKGSWTYPHSTGEEREKRDSISEVLDFIYIEYWRNIKAF